MIITRTWKLIYFHFILSSIIYAQDSLSSFCLKKSCLKKGGGEDSEIDVRGDKELLNGFLYRRVIIDLLSVARSRCSSEYGHLFEYSMHFIQRRWFTDITHHIKKYFRDIIILIPDIIATQRNLHSRRSNTRYTCYSNFVSTLMDFCFALSSII